MAEHSEFVFDPYAGCCNYEGCYGVNYIVSGIFALMCGSSVLGVGVWQWEKTDVIALWIPMIVGALIAGTGFIVALYGVVLFKRQRKAHGIKHRRKAHRFDPFGLRKHDSDDECSEDYDDCSIGRRDSGSKVIELVPIRAQDIDSLHEFEGITLATLVKEMVVARPVPAMESDIEPPRYYDFDELFNEAAKKHNSVFDDDYAEH